MEELSANPLKRNGIQVIWRASAILRALRDDPVGLSLGQIAERVGLARSTVQRIVAALQDEGLVIAMGNGGIRLGPEITTLAAAVTFDVVDLCRPFLRALVKRTGETADLSILRNQSMVFLDQMPGQHRLRAASAVGQAFPLTTTANGRAALAALPDKQARKLCEIEWNSTGSEDRWKEFARRLSQIRSDGLAYDLDEHTVGISAIGVAFAAHSRETYSISVPIPTYRFEELEETVARELLGVSQALAQELAELGNG